MNLLEKSTSSVLLPSNPLSSETLYHLMRIIKNQNQ